MTTSRERLEATLDHRQPDRVVVDIGASGVTGMHASAVSRLREALLGDPGYRVRVSHLMMFTGEIDAELRAAMPVDVAGVFGRSGSFGFPNEPRKPWRQFDGIEVRVPERFDPTQDRDGNLLMYPLGDRSLPASAIMPRGGHYFDPIVRQGELDEGNLDPADNLEEFGLLSDEDVADYARRTADLFDSTEYGLFGNIPGVWGLGDAMNVPAASLPHPRGVRDLEEWYISLVARPAYIRAVFERETELMIENIGRLAEAVGDRIAAVRICGTDFGGQEGLLISRATYREVFSPYYRAINDAVHRLTKWRTFKHCDGAILELIPDLIDDGFDILNPIQTATAGMDPKLLKREFGKELVFWGAGVETQTTLPFGTPDEVYREARERIEIFNDEGGFVFAAIHNIQPGVPVPNLMAMLRAIRDSW
jgi:hypothetical protein